jgi:hypothetical protein
MRSASTLVALILVAGALAAGRAGARQAPLALPPPAERPDRFFCGTDEDRAREMRLRPRTVVPAGGVISFEQDPPILTADYCRSSARNT